MYLLKSSVSSYVLLLTWKGVITVCIFSPHLVHGEVLLNLSIDCFNNSLNKCSFSWNLFADMLASTNTEQLLVVFPMILSTSLQVKFGQKWLLMNRLGPEEELRSITDIVDWAWPIRSWGICKQCVISMSSNAKIANYVVFRSKEISGWFDSSHLHTIGARYFLDWRWCQTRNFNVQGLTVLETFVITVLELVPVERSLEPASLMAWTVMWLQNCEYLISVSYPRNKLSSKSLG